MYAGKRFNGNPSSTKMSKVDGVAPVDNRPSLDKNGVPIQLCMVVHDGFDVFSGSWWLFVVVCIYLWLFVIICSSYCFLLSLCFLVVLSGFW